MDFKFTPEQEKLRSEVESWLNDNYPENYTPSRMKNYDSTEEWSQGYRELQRRLYDAGYAGMNYPKEYGGQGKTVMEEIIVLQTICYFCLELRWPGIITHGMAAPVILNRGNERQKREFLPKLLNGSHLWGQGFSEPNAGSDMANVSTKAVKKNDHYVVNGQKVWNSWGHVADFCLLLVRTDTSGPKHEGLTYLILDMKSPGVKVKPITQITGESEFNELYLDDVCIPTEMLLGEEGEGWAVAMTTLMFERVIGDVLMAAGCERNVDEMIESCSSIKRKGRPVIEDAIFRQELAKAYTEAMVLKYHGLRNLSNQVHGGVPGPEGSIGKLLWSEPNQRITETAMAILGPYSQIMRGSEVTIQDGHWQYAFLRAVGNTIEAGTSEIQRNIIGERVLGLPKDTSRAERV